MRLLTCLLIVRFFVCVCVSKTIHSRNGSKRSKLPGKTRLEQDFYFLYKFSLLTDLHKSQRNYDNHNKAKKEGGERERQQGDCSYVCSYACGKTIHLGSSTASFCPYYTPILPFSHSTQSPCLALFWKGLINPSEESLFLSKLELIRHAMSNTFCSHF